MFFRSLPPGSPFYGSHKNIFGKKNNLEAKQSSAFCNDLKSSTGHLYNGYGRKINYKLWKEILAPYVAI